MKLKHYLLAGAALIALVVIVLYNYPNLYMSGKDLYDEGVQSFNNGNHTDYYNLDMIRDAAAYFNDAIDKGYNTKIVYNDLANCYHILTKEADAEHTYTLAIKQYPNDGDFRYFRAVTRQKLGNAIGAFNDYDSIIKVVPHYKNIAHIYYERGALRYMAKDSAAALHDLMTARALSGQPLPAYQSQNQTVPQKALML
jgi:tetratricopeptide (TPR) repeat protein